MYKGNPSLEWELHFHLYTKMEHVVYLFQLCFWLNKNFLLSDFVETDKHGDYIDFQGLLIMGNSEHAGLELSGRVIFRLEKPFLFCGLG